MKTKFYALNLIAALLASAASAQIIHFTDFIPDGTRTGFMGFEGLPAVDNFGASHQEGGIEIFQVGGETNDIWTYAFAADGSRGWYPNGADRGYTRLTLTSGADFDSVGFRVSTGYVAGSTGTYNLLNNGALVASGNFTLEHWVNAPSIYLGFSAGGFDEIRLADYAFGPAPIGSGGANALAIDSIEIFSANGIGAVPEPSTYGLLGSALIVGIVAFRRRSKRT